MVLFEFYLYAKPIIRRSRKFMQIAVRAECDFVESPVRYNPLFSATFF